MNQEDLAKGFAQLDSLARDEYRQALKDVASDDNHKRAAIRVGRLIGVMLKEPFAESQTVEQASNRTKAYRSWHLTGAEAFDDPKKRETWQYKTLEALRDELASKYHNYRTESVYGLARDANKETGFFGYLARSLRNYICHAPEIRKKVDESIKDAQGNINIPNITPEMIVGSGGLALGGYLVSAIPILGFVGAPAIAGIVVILYTLGVDAFCEWTDKLRTDEDEK